MVQRISEVGPANRLRTSECFKWSKISIIITWHLIAYRRLETKVYAQFDAYKVVTRDAYNHYLLKCPKKPAQTNTVQTPEGIVRYPWRR